MTKATDGPADVKPGPTLKHVSDDAIESAIEANHGNLAAAARSLGVPRKTLCDRVQKRPHLERARLVGHQSALDIAEAALMRAVIAGEAWAVCFFLKTRGRGRGYSEKGASGPSHYDSTVI